MKEGSGGTTIMIFVIIIIIIIIILILEGDKIKLRTKERKETAMCQGFHLLLKYQYLQWVIMA